MSFFLNWFKQGSRDFPPNVQAYISKAKEIDFNAHLDELSYMIFDTETTSLEVKSARLLSLGAVKISKGKIEAGNALNCVIKWSENVDRPSNVEIHGIMPSASKQGMPPEEAIDIFLQAIRSSVLVAHHADFDVAIINETLDRYYPGLVLKNPVLDTGKIAIRLEAAAFNTGIEVQRGYSLDQLIEKYKIEPLERHTALGDAYTTAVLFLKLKHLLKARGIIKLSQLI